MKSRVFLCENVKFAPKTGVKTWFQIAGVTVNFSYLVRECVKIVISNREIVDVLGCLDIKDHLSKRTTMVESTIVSNANHF